MGKKQVLIVLLGLFIVGLTVHVGVDLFNRTMRQRHIDRLMGHAVGVASEVVAWRSKRSPFLGGGSSYENLNIDGMVQLVMAEHRSPSTIQITFASRDSLEITAISNDYADIGVQVNLSGVEIVQTAISYDGSITLPHSPETID